MAIPASTTHAELDDDDRDTALEIREHLDENPGLKPSVADVLAQAYKTARLEVSGRWLRRSDPQPPDSCPWTFEQVIRTILAGLAKGDLMGHKPRSR